MELLDLPSTTSINGDSIGSATSIGEIINALDRRGCSNLTSTIDLTACSKFPCGGGGFCDVFQGALHDGTKIAIKTLRVFDRPGQDSCGQKILKRTARELYHWSKLRHRNVLPLMGLAIFREQISMVSEWIENGSLKSYLRLNPGANRIKLCMDICEGLSYIHTNNMVHGDMKAANILVSSDETALIADFGNAELRDLTLRFTNTTRAGFSVRWTAPELLLATSNPQCSKEADVYAYGMTVFEAMTGKVPFEEMAEYQVILLVARQAVPPRPDVSMDDELWNILKLCWAPEPAERPSIADIQDHLQTLVQPEGKKCRNVTAPPTDSMKFGPCRDFFLAHLGDPYPTTVQKHQILKRSSPDFTLRSLNLWFVNTRRRSKWMDIFRTHAGSKRDAMRDLVARVEAQVAGRPAPNPLPSGAAPPGCKVDQAVVEEVMAMRAVVDMVSREVYGEGWDQILQIKPWTDEEVRAHEEKKKATRREARAHKADEGKRKREREELRVQRKREREQRKRIEQEAVDGIRAARELHIKLMAMNKRKRDDNDESSEVSSKRRKSKDTEFDENGAPKKRKLKVPKYDDSGNPLTKEQRKAIKRAMLAAQEQNPLKRKSPDLQDSALPPNDGVDTSPSKRRRRDALTFDNFPAPGASGEAAGPEGMADLTQLFSMEWASPPTASAPLPSVQESTPPPAPPRPGYGGFALPSESHVPAQPSGPSTEEAGGEVPRRFSQQLAAFALESGMFDGQNFELFTADTFPGMEVDVHSGNPMPAAPSENMFGANMNTVSDFGANVPQPVHLNTNTSVADSMSVSPNQSQLQTPMQQFATPTQHHVPPFEFAPPDHHPRQAHETNGYADSSQHSNADSSDMSWINAALEHLPSQHDVARMGNTPQYPTHGPEFSSQVHSQSNFPTQYGSQQESEFESRPSTAVSDWHNPAHQQRMPPVQVQPQQRMSYPSASSPPTPMASQPRPTFPQPQAKPSAPQPPARTAAPPPQPKQRAPGSLWQTPQSQGQQQRYSTPGPSTYQQPSFPAPAPHSFPAPAASPYVPQSQPPQPYAPTPYGERSPEQHRTPQPSSSTDTGSYGQRYPPTPTYQEPQPQPQPQPQHPQQSPVPSVDPKIALKEREAEFARAQEALQAQFRREQEEQLARFMRAQEELRNQLLGSGSGSRTA